MLGIEKTQAIIQAEQGESLGIERISIYETSATEKGFKNELAYYGVKDIFAETQIKRDGDNYIFFIKQQPKFLLDKNVFVNFIQRFYQDKQGEEAQQTQEAILIRLKEIKGEQTLEYIKGELDNLKQEIENNINKPTESTDILTIKYKLERLITFFQQEKSLTNQRTGKIFGQEYKRPNNGLRKIQKKEIENRIRELETIKQQIERLQKNKNKKYQIKRDEGNGEFKDIVMDDINGYDTNLTLAQFNARIEELGKEAPEFIKQRNDILLNKADSTPGYNIQINTPEDALILQKALQKENDEYKILNKIKLNTAQQAELHEDLKRLDEYLTAIIKNPNNFRPTELAFIPTHAEEFNQLYKIDPTLKKYYTPARQAKTSSEEYIDDAYTTSQDQINTPNTTTNKTIITTNTTREVQNNDIIDPSYTGYKDAIERHGVRGAIYKTFDYFPNMKAEQKSFWTNALFLGGMGFVLWKVGKWFFTDKIKKNDKGERIGGTNFRERLAIIGGITLGSNMLTGKSPIEFIDKAVNGGFKFDDIKRKFWEKSGEASENAKTVIVNPLTATFLVGNNKISDLTNTIDPKTFDFKNYDTLLQTAIETGNTDMQILLQKVAKDKSIMRTGLAQMGITPENIGQLDQDMLVDDYFVRYMENMQTSEKYRIKNKLTIVKGKENDHQKLITSGKELTEADLEKANHEGMFEAANTVDSEEIKKAKAVLYKQVDDLTNITADKESIKIGVGEFYETMPQDTNGNKILSIIQQGDKTYIETYGQKTVIDFNKKILKGFSDTTGNEYVFPGYAELIAAANLTNRLRAVFKDKTAQSVDPFHIDATTGKLEFDNTKRYELWKKETSAVSGGWLISGGWFNNKLEKISHTLENHRAEYCKYLNTQKFRKTAPAQ